MKVGDIMTKNVITVQVGTKVSEVINKMNETKVRYMPVMDGEKLVGVVTDGDILFRVYAHGLAPDEMTIEQIMTKDVITIGPELDELQAMGLLAGHHIRRLPVVKEGRLVGIISMTDIESRIGMF